MGAWAGARTSIATRGRRTSATRSAAWLQPACFSFLHLFTSTTPSATARLAFPQQGGRTFGWHDGGPCDGGRACLGNGHGGRRRAAWLKAANRRKGGTLLAGRAGGRAATRAAHQADGQAGVRHRIGNKFSGRTITWIHRSLALLPWALATVF